MIDFSDLSPDEMEVGFSIPAGWYRCTVRDVFENPRAVGITTVELLITHGAHKGGVIEDGIVSPDNARDVDKAKKCKQRIAMYLTRLGAYTKEQLAGQHVEVEWDQLIGRECFVKAKEESWTKDDKSGVRTKPEFDGIYAITDERVPAEVRAKNGVNVTKSAEQASRQSPTQPAPTAPPAAPTKPPRKPRVDYSGL